jgi:hypothetical protein
MYDLKISDLRRGRKLNYKDPKQRSEIKTLEIRRDHALT